jgi:hypothetical protein
MDHRELEEKLERDNFTLKEHIMKLQNTIKQIKGEINTNDYSRISYNHKEDKSNKANKNQHNDLREHLYEEHENLKFSFNSKPNITEEYSTCSKKEDRSNNFYQENLKKIRQEREMIKKMEDVKKKANIKKNYSEEDSDDGEIERFHKNFRKRRASDDEYEEEKKKDRPIFKDSKIY